MGLSPLLKRKKAGMSSSRKLVTSPVMSNSGKASIEASSLDTRPLILYPMFVPVGSNNTSSTTLNKSAGKLRFTTKLTETDREYLRKNKFQLSQDQRWSH